MVIKHIARGSIVFNGSIHHSIRGANKTMNVQRAIIALHNANIALQRKNYISAEQRKVLRRAKAKARKIIAQFTNPTAPARPLPPPPNQLNISI